MATTSGGRDPGEGQPPKQDKAIDVASSSKTADWGEDDYIAILRLAIQYRSETGIMVTPTDNTAEFHQYVTHHGLQNITLEVLMAILDSQHTFNRTSPHEIEHPDPILRERFLLARYLWSIPASLPPLPPGRRPRPRDRRNPSLPPRSFTPLPPSTGAQENQEIQPAAEVPNSNLHQEIETNNDENQDLTDAAILRLMRVFRDNSVVNSANDLYEFARQSNINIGQQELDTRISVLRANFEDQMRSRVDVNSLSPTRREINELSNTMWGNRERNDDEMMKEGRCNCC